MPVACLNTRANLFESNTKIHAETDLRSASVCKGESVDFS